MGHGVDALHRLNVTMVLAGQNVLQSFWLRSKPTTPSNTFKNDTDGAISEFYVTVWPKYKAIMSAQVQLIAAVATTLNPLNAAQSVASYTIDFGAIAGEALPPHDAMLLSLYTSTPGRRTHGRLYIPGVPESLHQNGIVENSHVTKIGELGQILCNHWGEGGTSSRFWGGVYSRKNGQALQPGPPPYYTYSPLAHVPWTRFIARGSVKTVRSRMVGRGI